MNAGFRNERKKEEKKHVGGNKQRKRKIVCVRARVLNSRPSCFLIQNTTALSQRVHVSRALCIIVSRSRGSDLSVILGGLEKGSKKENYFITSYSIMQNSRRLKETFDM